MLPLGGLSRYIACEDCSVAGGPHYFSHWKIASEQQNSKHLTSPQDEWGGESEVAVIGECCISTHSLRDLHSVILGVHCSSKIIFLR